MNTALLVYIINCISLVMSVAQLCIASSIFDFIVINRMFYTTHNEEVLIDPSTSLLFFLSPVLSTLLSLLTVLIPQCPSSIQATLGRHPFLVAVIHATLLVGCCLLFAFCSICSAQLSHTVGHFAYNGTPQKFQDASLWYFIRLRAATIFFGLQSISSLTQIGLLYLGIECRYRIITPQIKNAI